MYSGVALVADCGARTGRPLQEQVANAILIAAIPDVINAMLALLSDTPYVSDATFCECGTFEAERTCCHVQAHKALVLAGQE